MKTNHLFPHHYKKIGWILFIPGALLGILYLLFESGLDLFDASVFSIASSQLLKQPVYFGCIENNILDELAALLLITGSLLIAFSKQSAEDEYISQIRFESLVWAVYLNYAILLITIPFVYDIMFFWVLVFNMFTVLIFFIIRFHWALYKSKNQIADEE